MSDILTEIDRIQTNVNNTLTAIRNKGVTVPSDANSNNMADLVSSIESGGGWHKHVGCLSSRCYIS